MTSLGDDAEVIDALKSQIETINSRLEAIESRLQAAETRSKTVKPMPPMRYPMLDAVIKDLFKHSVKRDGVAD